MKFQQSPPFPYSVYKQNQLELWHSVLGFNVELFERFCSPFRNDSSPGCWLEYVGEYIRLRDFADPYRHRKTIFELVMFERNCDFNEALIFLASKTKLEPTKNENRIINDYKKQFLIKSYPVKNKAGKIVYTDEHLSFWSQYGIVPQQLLTDYVFPIQGYKAGLNRYNHTVITKDIAFSYHFKSSRHQKIYRPTKIDPHKWITNCDQQDIWFWKHIDYSQSYLIITKSYKDARILKNLKYNVIAVQSESTYLPDNYIKYLEKKFDKLFVLFDNDEEGINYIMKHQDRYNNLTNTLKFIPVWYDTTLPKDTGDVYSEYGKEKVIKELKNMI
jgi:hypothetical protein